MFSPYIPRQKKRIVFSPPRVSPDPNNPVVPPTHLSTPRDRHVVLHPFTFDAADVPLRSFTSLTHARKLRIDAIVYQCQRLELVGVRDLGEDEMGGFLLVDWWKCIYIYTENAFESGILERCGFLAFRP